MSGMEEPEQSQTRGVELLLGPLGWAGIASLALFGCTLGLLIDAYFDVRDAASPSS